MFYDALGSNTTFTDTLCRALLQGGQKGFLMKNNDQIKVKINLRLKGENTRRFLTVSVWKIDKLVTRYYILLASTEEQKKTCFRRIGLFTSYWMLSLAARSLTLKTAHDQAYGPQESAPRSCSSRAKCAENNDPVSSTSVCLFQQPDGTNREESTYSPQSVEARGEMLYIS